MPLSPKRILLVDGEPQQRIPILTMLKRFGYIVQTAGQSRVADAMLKKHRFDLIIVNDRLADIAGKEYLRRIGKENGGKMIFLSSQGSVEEFVQIIQLGAFEYVRKPISPVQFAVIVCDFFIESLKDYQMPLEKLEPGRRLGA